MLDNASDDGSADAVEAWNASAEGLGDRLRLIRTRAPRGQGAARQRPAARGARRALPAAQRGLRAARRGGRGAGRGAARRPARRRPPGRSCSTRPAARSPARGGCPASATSLAGALFLHRWVVVESGGRTDAARSAGCSRRRCSSAARPRGRSAISTPTSSSTPTRPTSASGSRDAGWRILYVPAAEVVHHEQLATDIAARERRIVEFHRGRDRYLRKHRGRAVALAGRLLSAWSYGVRALVAALLPGHDPALYRLHARQALRPDRGEGLREAAAAYNLAGDLNGGRDTAAANGA